MASPSGRRMVGRLRTPGSALSLHGTQPWTAHGKRDQPATPTLTAVIGAFVAATVLPRPEALGPNLVGRWDS